MPFKDFSLSSVTAGFITVLVGYTSSVALIFAATQALHATPAQTASWLWALGIGMGLTCIGLSWYYKQPVVTAWSTPGAAVIATAAAANGGLTMSDAIGAFIVCALLVIAAGATGWFERVMKRIPMALASALLAGVLARFAMEAFVSLKTQFALVLAMFVTYLIGKRWFARYAVVAVLLVGIAWAAAQGLLDAQALPPSFAAALAQPLWTTPTFSVSAVIGLALPLFVVTMASQNMAGVAVMRASGYDTPVSPVITCTGIATLALAPFGAFALNLAAITAAICMGPEAHADQAKRYTASVAAGVFYLLLGIFGAAVAGLLAAFPRELVIAVAGFALLGTIAGGLATAMKDDATREAALVTFVVTLSGVSLWGVGSAFWGVVAGAGVLLMARR
jgi:benzoate membrane transport protein